MMFRQAKGIALVSVLLILSVMVALISYMVESQFLAVRQANVQLIDEVGFVENLQAETWAFNALTKASSESYETDTLLEIWSDQPFELNDGVLKTGLLVDLQGKFNLNNLHGAQQQIWLPLFQNLLKTLQLDENLAYAVIDWIDEDQNLTNANGVEDQEYLLETPSRRAANQKFSTVEELLLVKGIDSAAYQALLPHITVLIEDDIKINVNTASLEVIKSFLPDNSSTLGKADQLKAARDEEPFKSVSDLEQSNALAGSSLNDVIGIQSNYFEMKSSVEIGDVKKTYKMGLKRDVSNNGVSFTVIYRKRSI